MEFEEKITIAKRITNLYKLVIGLTPIVFAIFSFVIADLSEKLYVKQFGNTDKELVLNEGLGIMIFLIPIIFIFSIPFFIWTIKLSKTIKDSLTRSQTIQLVILGLFPVSVYLYYDIQFIISIIDKFIRLHS